MYDIKEAPEVVARGAVSTWKGYSHVRAQRTANWLRCARTVQPASHSLAALPMQQKKTPHRTNRRMVPHVFGWFTMTSVWFILFTQLEHARRDIHEVSDRNIPEWVYSMIVGTSLIFMSFALVRVVPPSNRLHIPHALARSLTWPFRLAGPNRLPTCARTHPLNPIPTLVPRLPAC